MKDLLTWVKAQAIANLTDFKAVAITPHPGHVPSSAAWPILGVHSGGKIERIKQKGGRMIEVLAVNLVIYNGDCTNPEAGVMGSTGKPGVEELTESIEAFFEARVPTGQPHSYNDATIPSDSPTGEIPEKKDALPYLVDKIVPVHYRRERILS